MERPYLPDKAPLDPNRAVNQWRYDLRKALEDHSNQIEELGSAEPETPSADILAMRPQYALYSGGSGCFAPAIDEDHGVLGWCSAISGRYRAVFATRGENRRWRHIADLPLDSATSGQNLAIVDSPDGATDISSMLYVPDRDGGGTGHGMFWLASITNNEIRLVNPETLATSDHAIGTASNNVTAYASLRYSASEDRVYCIMGGGTRLCSIDPATMTLDNEDTSLTSLRSIDLAIRNDITEFVWVTRNTSGTDVLYRFTPDLGTQVDTNTNITATPHPILYLPDVHQVLLSHFGATGFQVVDATSYAVTDVFAFTSNVTTNRMAYISELHAAAICGSPDFMLWDTRGLINSVVGTTVGAMGYLAGTAGGTGWSTNKHDCLWSATYRELYVANGDNDQLWICY